MQNALCPLHETENIIRVLCVFVGNKNKFFKKSPSDFPQWP